MSRGASWWSAQAARAMACAVFCFCVVGPTFAADDNKVIYPGGNAGDRSAPATPSAGGSFNTISLVLAAALAGVGGWMVWRNRQRAVGGRDSRALALEETRSLGNRQYLVVASYEGKKFLLGVCPGRIEMLTPLGESEAKVAKDSR